MLAGMDHISLWQTTENLQERDNLRVVLDGIGSQILKGVATANEIRDLVKVVSTEYIDRLMIIHSEESRKSQDSMRETIGTTEIT